MSKLTQKDLEGIKSFIQKHNVRRTCTMCPEGQYKISGNLLYVPDLVTAEENNIAKATRNFAFVIYKCNVCGNTQLFNAKEMGFGFGD